MNKELIYGLCLILMVMVTALAFLGINQLLTHYLLKRCIKCFHLLDKNGQCQYCERERKGLDYE